MNNSNNDQSNDISIQTLLDVLPFYALILDEHHNIIYANSAVGKAFNIDPSTLIGKYCPKAIHDSDKPVDICPLEESLRSGRAVEVKVFDKNISRWFKSSILPLNQKTEDGLRLYMHFIEDITAQVNSEEEIKHNYLIQTKLNEILQITFRSIYLDEMLDKILQNILSIDWIALESRGAILLVEDDPSVLVMKVQKGLSIEIKEMCSKVPFGRCICGKAAVSGKIEFTDCVGHSHENTYEGIKQHGHYCVPIKVKGEIRGVINLYLKEGHKRKEKEEEFLHSVSAIIAGMLERDILQNKMMQQQKLASLGQMSAGIVHELNNPLTLISGFSGYLFKALSKTLSEENKQAFKNIIESTDRMRNIVKDLLLFSRSQGTSARTSVNINEIVTKVIALENAYLKHEDVDVSTEFGAIPDIFVESEKLIQVFVNFFSNSMHALKNTDKKSIWIKTSYEEAGNLVSIVFKDTGKGINKQILNKIYDPFFTTKEVGSGTGLGLSIVKEIIELSGGTISVKSEEGKFTEFTLKFPSHQKETESITNNGNPTT